MIYFPYTVQAGDTIWGIANMFDTTVEAIQRVNGFSENEYTLYEGQIIYIPFDDGK